MKTRAMGLSCSDVQLRKELSGSRLPDFIRRNLRQVLDAEVSELDARRPEILVKVREE